MKINIKAVAAVVVSAMLPAGVFAFCGTQGKYAFVSEPRLEVPVTGLTSKPLESRQPLTTQLLREVLENDVQLAVYDAVAEHALNADGEMFWVDGAGVDDLRVAVSAFRGDHPEVFWLDPNAGYQYYDNGSSVTVELNFFEAGETLEADRQLLNEAVWEICANAPANADDYEIELYLNDWLTDNCVYSEKAESRHTSFGALVQGEAVCDGYSRAFQLLCRQLGVECIVVEGTSDFSDKGDGHMWNCVQLGDNWYHVDATWNDSTGAACGAAHYFYLNLTTEEIGRDHVISGNYAERDDGSGGYFNLWVPDCNSTALNYMRRNFVAVADPEDDAAIIASLLNAARQKESFCAFLLDEGQDFSALAQTITQQYAASWIQGTNHFLQGNPAIAGNGRVVTYESKRVMAILLEYQ